MTDKRTYTVIERDHAISLGVKPTSHDLNRYALVAMRGEVLDTFVAWCYNKENAQRVADQRNADFDAMRSTMEKTLIRDEASSMPTGQPGDAPKKRGRPPKMVDVYAVPR